MGRNRVTARPKLLVYALLTQFIILAGTARERLRLDERIRKDRTFASPAYPYGQAPRDAYRGAQPGRWHLGQIACCDCGLAHKTWVELDEHGPIEFAQPVRPAGYTYQLRTSASPSSAHVPEEERFALARRYRTELRI